MKKIKNAIRLVLLTVLSCLAFAFSSSAIVNGTFADAQKINVNTKYTGNISSYEDVDYYKFTISKDGYINISFNHDNLFNNNRYWSAELFDSSTNKICEYIFIGSEPSVKTKNTGLSAGTYYLKIAPYYLSTIKYTFSVNYKSSSVWETENRNNSFSQARTMKLNTKYYGALQDYSDNDYFKFTLPNDGIITIKFTHKNLLSNLCYFKYYVYDSSTNEMMVCLSNGTDVSFD